MENKNKNVSLLVLIALYIIFAIGNVFNLIKWIIQSPINWPYIFIYGFSLIAFWIIIYLLGQKKKIAFKAVISFEIVRIISLIITGIFITLPYLSLLNESGRNIIITIVVVKLLIPFVFIWLAYKNKKILVN
jgi:hypothetical protein